jgi:hypothetical protein
VGSAPPVPRIFSAGLSPQSGIGFAVHKTGFDGRRHAHWFDRIEEAFAVKSKANWRDQTIRVALVFAIVAGGHVLTPHGAAARDFDGRYANSPLHSWFESLRSGKGPCCSDADGTALSDVDWEAKDGHYRVRIEGQWWNVPDEAVITEPNRAGRTMVWPVYYRSVGTSLRVEIRCFMPGTMT